MSSITAVATLQVTSSVAERSTWDTNPWGTKIFTFFKDANPDILQFRDLKTEGGVVQNGELQTLTNTKWFEGFVKIYWDKQGGIIKWDTTTGGTECCQQKSAVVTPGGMQPQPPGITSLSGTSVTSSQSSTRVTETGLPASSGSVPDVPTPSMTAPPVSNPKNEGLSGGAMAGVAIGCLIAGALIAAVVLWLCLGRRRVRRSRHPETSAIALISPEKGPLTRTRSLGTGSSARLSPADAIPQPLEDQAISGEISKIANLVKNHVQSYYHSNPVNPGLIDLDDIIAIGRNIPISTGSLSALLDNTANREVALRFCIAWAIISRLQTYESSHGSLLPFEVCVPMSRISNAEHGFKAYNLQVARWRVATAQLMHSTYVQGAFTSSDSRNAIIQSLMRVLENILQPFADPRLNNDERRRNLEEILKRSALFAFTLFSQPSSWAFDWKEDHGVKSSELCIFPALVQVTNELGEPLRPPRSLSEAVVRRLEG